MENNNWKNLIEKEYNYKNKPENLLDASLFQNMIFHLNHARLFFKMEIFLIFKYIFRKILFFKGVKGWCLLCFS